MESDAPFAPASEDRVRVSPKKVATWKSLKKVVKRKRAISLRRRHLIFDSCAYDVSDDGILEVLSMPFPKILPSNSDADEGSLTEGSPSDVLKTPIDLSLLASRTRKSVDDWEGMCRKLDFFVLNSSDVEDDSSTEESLSDDCKTPKDAPLLSWFPTTCPGAPMRGAFRAIKKVNDWGDACRILDFSD